MYFEEHKSQREIARIEGKSLRDISKIIKAHRDRSDIIQSSKKNGAESRDSCAPRAYALYEKKYSTVEVAIKLGLDAKEAMQYYSDYLEMNSLGNLVTLHKNLDNNGINALVLIYDTMQKEGVSLDETKDTIKTVGSIKRIRSETHSEMNRIRELKIEVHGLSTTKNGLLEEIAKAREFNRGAQ